MKSFIFIFFISLTSVVCAQDYTVFQRTWRQLATASRAPGEESKATLLNVLWDSLKTKGIPLMQNDSVAFLYRGKAKTVEWIGDFNQWGYDKGFPNKGTRLGNTDIWMLKASFPVDARIDYKIVIDGSNRILDPENPFQQWSGVGGGSPNSELRMPQWRPDEAQRYRPEIPHGSVEQDLLFQSKMLNYQLTYGIYLPAGHQELGKLPVIYVTDGYEYAHPKMGNMVTVLDNLIAEKKIKPLIAIFIDHREPVNRSNNRRMEELAMSARYLDFFTDEFIPHIESKYPIDAGSKNRAILGNSMGGLSSAYFVFSRPEVFSMAGIQSPAFYTRPQIYSLCEKADGTPIKISMTSGVINDTSEGGRKMRAIFETNACKYTYREVNEGHSWGNWRGLIDDILIDLFAP